MYCPLWFSLAFLTDDTTAAPAIMLAAIFAIWGVVTAFYSHCPKEYKNVQISRKVIVKRSFVSILGIITSCISFLIMIVWIVLVTA